MADGDWTFGSATFVFLDEGTPPLSPIWKHAPRVAVHPEVGGASASLHVFGFGEWALEGRIRCETSDDHTALQDANGTFQDLSDGTTTWSALGIVDLNPIAGGAGGYEGTARFVRGS